MDEINRKKIKALIHKFALKYNLRDKDMKELSESRYEFTHSIIKGLDLTEVKNKEDLLTIKTNFVYMGFGKLFIDKDKVGERIKNKNIILIKNDGRNK